MKELKPIYEYRSYKAYISDRCAHNKLSESLTKLCLACHMQLSYLSKCLRSKTQITRDQAFLMTEFWGLSEKEAQYFLLLVDYDRSANSKYRSHLQKQIDVYQREASDLKGRVQIQTVTPTAAFDVTYNSSWIWPYIHFLTSIPECQTLKKICEKAEISADLCQFYLQELQKQNLIQKKGEHWIYETGAHHLDKTSPLILSYHHSVRQRTSTEMVRKNHLQTDNLHVSNIQTLSQHDAMKIRKLLLEFIEKSAKIAGPSTPEKTLFFACDFVMD